MDQLNPQILLLDDEPQHLVTLERMLMVPGMPALNLAPFVEPAAALNWCRAHPPDLCLIDYRMPQLDGLRFIDRVRRLPGFETVLLVLATGAAEKSARREALVRGAVEVITKPYAVDDVMRLRSLLALRHPAVTAAPAFAASDLAAPLSKATLREHAAIVRKLTRLSRARDEETGNHMRRVAHIARLIARAYGMDQNYCTMLFLAAPMHDVGKAGIPDRILMKQGKLDAAEWEIMKTHTRIGHDLLRGSQAPLLRLGAEISLTHHEKYDGSGYPNGLRSEDIPLCGRIVAVADGLDALLSVRSYKAAWSANDALAYLWRERGKHFDPGCVDIVLAHADEILDIERRFIDVAPAPTPAYDPVLLAPAVGSAAPRSRRAGSAP
jgi:response regulator RpfG family c-di-GMP phosphodiesterase